MAASRQPRRCRPRSARRRFGRSRGLELLPVVLGDAEREIDPPASVASSRRPSAARRNSAGSYGAKNAAGVTLWYCRTRPPGSAANASVIGDGSAKWKIVTSPLARRRIANGRTSSRSRRRSSARRARTRGPCARSSVAHPPGAVADRVALVRRRHPLVDDHRGCDCGLAIRRFDRQGPNSEFRLVRRQRLVDRRAVQAQLLELLRGVELLPRNRTRRAAPARAARRRMPSTNREQRAGEVLRAAAGRPPRQLAVDDPRPADVGIARRSRPSARAT